MKPLKVVIIDDEEAHFRLMKRAINKALPLASVDYFKDAKSCLERLDEISPDVIILDYLMPVMNGIEFLEALSRENKDIPVIMITGQGNENIAVQAMKLGAWDYLVKTPDFSTLLPSVIEKVVHERKLKDTVRESERRFRDLAESTSDWIWEVDAEGKYVYSNPVIQTILGYRPDEMLGKYFYDFFSEKEKKTLTLTSLQAMVEGKPISGLDTRCIHKDGHEVVLETSGVPFFDKAGNLLGYRGINRDVSERKRMQAALEKSEERYRTSFDNSRDAINIFSIDRNFLDVNKKLIQLSGYSKKELLSMRLEDLYPESVKPATEERIKKILQGEEIPVFETYVLTKGGEKIPVEIGVSASKNCYGQEIVFQGNIRDIIERKRAQEHVQTLSRQLMKAQEAERQRLSHNLHDLVGQDLSALKIRLDTLFDDQPEVPPGTRQRVAELSKMVQETIMAVRDLAYGLRPTSLDQLGLAKTILRYCEEFSARTGVKVDFFAAGLDDLKLDSDTEITLYRLIQEGFNNVKKHADATEVTIRLVASFPDIILRIEDNGKGFDIQNRFVSALNEKRMGLRSMEERVALLGGKMSIESRAMQGTKILIEIPIKGRT